MNGMLRTVALVAAITERFQSLGSAQLNRQVQWSRFNGTTRGSPPTPGAGGISPNRVPDDSGGWAFQTQGSFLAGASLFRSAYDWELLSTPTLSVPRGRY